MSSNRMSLTVDKILHFIGLYQLAVYESCLIPLVKIVYC